MAYNVQTFGNVVDDTFAELGLSSSNGVAGLSTTQVLNWANRFSKIFLDKVKLKTQEQTQSFRTKADTQLSQDYSENDTTIVLSADQSTNNYPQSGLVLIDSIPHFYSTYTGTTMTLTDGLMRDFSAGDVVNFGYILFIDVGKPKSLTVSGGSDMIPRISPQTYELMKWGSQKKVKPMHYSIISDGPTQSDYLFLPEGMSNDQDVTLRYYKKASDEVDDTDDMEIYQMWDQFVTYMGAARGHRLLHDDEMAKTYERQAQIVLIQAKQQVAEEDLSVNRGFSPGF